MFDFTEHIKAFRLTAYRFGREFARNTGQNQTVP